MLIADKAVRTSPSQVWGHAETADAIADEVATAGRTARVVQLRTSAFGHLCQWLPSLIESVQGVTVDAVVHAAESIHATSTNLRAVAVDYAHCDAASTRRFGQAGSH